MAATDLAAAVSSHHCENYDRRKMKITTTPFVIFRDLLVSRMSLEDTLHGYRMSCRRRIVDKLNSFRSLRPKFLFPMADSL